MRRLRMRYLTVIAVASLLTGCAADVVMLNPRTGEKAICKESLQGFNPWSQKEGCVGRHIAEGWIRDGGD
jgi:hypothetical protein